MTKSKIYLISFSISICLLTSCVNTGYGVINEKVTYTVNGGMAFESKTYEIIGADKKTFIILKDKKFATDKNRAYFCGKPIADSDGKSFELLNDFGYSKDKKFVYIDSIKIISANPSKFNILQMPYSKDDKNIYCGSIPMEVKNINEFKVTKTGGLQITSRTSYFKEDNKEYKFLDTIKYPWVVHGEGNGETKTEKFENFKKLKNYR
jgi:hypothetical protein